MITQILKIILRTIIRHPWRCLIGLIAFIVVLIILTSSGGNDATTQQPTTTNSPPTTPVTPQPTNQAPPSAVPGSGGGVHHKRHHKQHKPSPGPQAPAPPSAVFQENPGGDAVRSGSPMLKRLPFTNKYIHAEIVDTTPNGQFVIQITYTGSQARARREWKKILVRSGDTGTSYVVLYKK